MVRILTTVFLILAGGLLQGCAGGMLGEDVLESRIQSKADSYERKQARLDAFLTAEGNRGNGRFRGVTELGTDRLTGPPIDRSFPRDDGAETLTLNLVGATIPQAAKSVLGNLLELNYTVDPAVQGAVTLQTSKPVSKRVMLNMFEDALRDNNAILVPSRNGYRIIPAGEAASAVLSVEEATGDLSKAGVRAQIVPLRFVSADEMKDVLTPMLPAGMLVRADPKRNALILNGTTGEIAAIRETISVFDVDWMRGMSFALVPVRSSSPDSIVRDLEQVFETKSGPLKGVLRFVPNRRLKSVLVISSRAKYVNDASKWIRKLDVLAESSEEGLHVYRVQNRTAAELAKVLQSILVQGGAPPCIRRSCRSKVHANADWHRTDRRTGNPGVGSRIECGV